MGLAKAFFWIIFTLIMLAFLAYQITDYKEDTKVIKKNIEDAQDEEEQTAKEIEQLKADYKEAKDKEDASLKEMQQLEEQINEASNK